MAGMLRGTSAKKFRIGKLAVVPGTAANFAPHTSDADVGQIAGALPSRTWISQLRNRIDYTLSAQLACTGIYRRRHDKVSSSSGPG